MEPKKQDHSWTRAWSRGDSELPAYRRLYAMIRDAVLDGTLAPGARLPATRNLASLLGVSRNTVLGAFDQLLAEGYLQGRRGAGTYVADLSEFAFPGGPAAKTRSSPKAKTAGGTNPRPANPGLSKRGRRIASIKVSRAKPFARTRPFQPGVPALDEFPMAEFSRLFGRYYRLLDKGDFGYSGPQGYGPLREAVTAYLRLSRGVACDPERVLIVNGSQEALDLCARLLLDPGDPCWMEDPGYLGARGAFAAAGGEIRPVSVDEHGMNVEQVLRGKKTPRVIYTTPSHQFPLGAVMSLERRLALLDFAARKKVWILEDDYDSEYRYAGRPLSSLQGLDRHERVIYIGTFSKVLFPAIRLAYMVVPESLVSAFRAARALVDRQSPLVPQAVLAHFMREGGFHAHIRRMRTLYDERRRVMLEEIASMPELTPAPGDTGMHLALYLPRGMNDEQISAQAAAQGLDLPALSPYYLGRARPGLLPGFAAFTPDEIRSGMGAVRGILEKFS